MALTYKQALFVEAYLGESNGNATDAARRAGYGEHRVTGHRLLTNANIRDKISQRVASAAMPANEVLARMSEIASSDIKDFLTIDRHGDYRVNLRRARRADRLRLVRKIKSTKYGTEVELEAKQPALQKLGEYHGLWDRPAAPDVAPGEIIAQARRKADERKRTRRAD